MSDVASFQIKGLVRFSYLSETGFAASKAGIEEVRKMLYDPGRLARRLRLFETLALHSLRHQTLTGFRVAVLIGEDFPQDARQKLEDLIRPVPKVELVALPPRPHIRAVIAAYDALADDPQATHTITFRLDDDDAMHIETLARIREIADQMIPLRDPDRPLVIGFNRGFYLDQRPEQPVLREMYERTPLGVGLAMVAPKAERTNIFRRNHRGLSQFFDVYTEVERPMFIRTVHGDNDSDAIATGREGTMGEGRMERQLKQGFRLSLDTLRAL